MYLEFSVHKYNNNSSDLIVAYCYPTTFPHSLHHIWGIYGIMGGGCLLPIYRSKCHVLSATVLEILAFQDQI
jgi:hypothetical protein